MSETKKNFFNYHYVINLREALFFFFFVWMFVCPSINLSFISMKTKYESQSTTTMEMVTKHGITMHVSVGINVLTNAIENHNSVSKNNTAHFTRLFQGRCAQCVRYTKYKLPYFSIDNAHLMYNAHPKLFRHSFWCIHNAHDVFFDR